MTTTTDGLGNRIRSARKAAGLAQVDLSAQVGVTQGLLSAYERGYRRPNVETLARLASSLDGLAAGDRRHKTHRNGGIMKTNESIEALRAEVRDLRDRLKRLARAHDRRDWISYMTEAPKVPSLDR